MTGQLQYIESTKKEYYSLTVAQRKFIFDRRYMHYIQTERALIKKGYVIPYENRGKTIINGIVKRETSFTQKCHDFVKRYCDYQMNSYNIDYNSNYIIINDEEFLKSLLAESILLGENFYITVNKKVATVAVNDINYMLHPHFLWKIEIDKSVDLDVYYEIYSKSQYYILLYNK
jgi:hypothetical protein